MGKFIDLTGQRFGRLVVINRSPNIKAGETLWLCQCDCGKTIITASYRLKNGITKSCGCLHIESARKQGKLSAKHSQTNTRLHRIWSNMKTRCFNSHNPKYKDYGGRGITICKEWLEFIPFRDWALSNGYKVGLTIDRINNNGNYEPSNCRWSTPKEQANNTRKTRLITWNGETLSLHGWAEKLGFKVETLFYRLKKMPIEEAFTKPSVFTKI